MLHFINTYNNYRPAIILEEDDEKLTVVIERCKISSDSGFTLLVHSNGSTTIKGCSLTSSGESCFVIFFRMRSLFMNY